MFIKNKGFTLVEMIVVVGILGLILLFTVPSLGYFATETVEVDLDAKSVALNRAVVGTLVDFPNKDVTKTFNLTNSTGSNPNTTTPLFQDIGLENNEVFIAVTTNSTQFNEGSAGDGTLTEHKDTVFLTHTDEFIVVIPVHDTTSNIFDITSDIYIYQPRSAKNPKTYKNGKLN